MSSDDDYYSDEELAIAEIDDIFRGHSDSDDSDDHVSFAPSTAQLGSDFTLKDLLKPIESSSKAATSSLKKNLLSAVSSAEPLPLSRTAKDRIERQEAYKQATSSVSQWQDTVKRNRSAPSVSFPLNATPVPRPTLHNLTAEDNEEDDYGDVLGVDVNDADDKAKLKSLLHHASVKAKHRKKIKSKKYRSLLKKEKQRQDALEADDPETMERERAKERLTLRHKNHSAFIKRKVRRGEAKHEDVNEAFQIGQELRQKVQGEQSEEESEYSSDGENEEEEEEGKGVFGMKFMQRAMEKAQKDGQKDGEKESDFELSDSDDSQDDVDSETAEAVVDSDEDDDSEKEVDDDDVDVKDQNGDVMNMKKFDFKVPKVEDSSKDAGQKLRKGSEKPVKKKKNAQDDDVSLQSIQSLVDDDVSSSDDDQKTAIQSILAENSNEKDFSDLKSTLVKEEHHVDLPEAVPGWGDWGGEGIKTKLNKKQQDVRKRLKKQQKHDMDKRRDAGKARVIIREKPEKIGQKYTVKQIPHEFKKKQDYERVLQRPISHDFVPISQHERLIKPKVVVGRGRVIQPIKRTQSMNRRFG
ncbi:hypothetical protein P9112_010790 [Eukaryota sp. TZLM1-RC]